MKKLFIIMTLFISSFFFLNIKASALSYYIYLTEEDFSLINVEFLKFRNQVIEFCGDSDNYIIYYENDVYKAIIADSDSSVIYGMNGSVAWFKVNNVDIYIYKDGNISFGSSISSETTIFSPSQMPFLIYLDTNFESITQLPNLRDYFLLSYNGVNASIPHKDGTLYNRYLRFFPSIELDPFEEDKGLLLNFYTCIIEKISFLANIFATNFVFLSIICIFVFIFVIDLVRRFIR